MAEICHGCGNHTDFYTEFLGESHQWLRCPACSKLKQVRLQAIRGQRQTHGFIEEANSFSGEIDLEQGLTHFGDTLIGAYDFDEDMPTHPFQKVVDDEEAA